MTKPNDEAQRILDWLVVEVLPGVNPGFPRSYAGYGQALFALGLRKVAKTEGLSLQAQGLESLAVWLRDAGLPAITGIIVSISDEDPHPGGGYFTVHGKDPEDTDWWDNEIKKAKQYPWLQHLSLSGARKLASKHEPEPENDDLDDDPEPPKGPDDTDPSHPNGIYVTVYRTLRDTALARRIKRIYKNKCQICRKTTKLFGDKTYAEGHHIKPLGRSFGGADVQGNILCVCPTCHVQLDYGAIPIIYSELLTDSRHEVDEAMVDYHNEKRFGKV